MPDMYQNYGSMLTNGQLKVNTGFSGKNQQVASERIHPYQNQEIAAGSHTKVREFIEAKEKGDEEKRQRQRDQILIDAGLYREEWVSEYSAATNRRYRYLKKFPLETTDEEFEKIKKRIEEERASYIESPIRNEGFQSFDQHFKCYCSRSVYNRFYFGDCIGQ